MRWLWSPALIKKQKVSKPFYQATGNSEQRSIFSQQEKLRMAWGSKQTPASQAAHCATLHGCWHQGVEVNATLWTTPQSSGQLLTSVNEFYTMRIFTIQEQSTFWGQGDVYFKLCRSFPLHFSQSNIIKTQMKRTKRWVLLVNKIVTGTRQWQGLHIGPIIWPFKIAIVNNWGIVTHTFNLSTVKTGAGRSLSIWGHLGLRSEILRKKQKTEGKIKKRRGEKKKERRECWGELRREWKRRRREERGEEERRWEGKEEWKERSMCSGAENYVCRMKLILKGNYTCHWEGKGMRNEIFSWDFSAGDMLLGK